MPTATPTGGAFSASAPSSRDDAVAAATHAYSNYLQTQAEVYATPSDSSRITEIAIDPLATNVQEKAASLVEKGITANFFGTTFDLDADRSSATTIQASDGSMTDWGLVTLFGCLDASTRVATLADGSLDPIPAPSIFLVTVTVAFDRSSSRWFVSEEGPEGGAATAC